MGPAGRKPTVPKVLNHDNAKRLLESQGWVATIGGKHSTKMEKPGMRPITLPRHSGRDYGPALRAAIVKQAGLNPLSAAQDPEETSEP